MQINKNSFPGHSPASPDRIRILVVEDSPTQLQQLSHYLAGEGYEVMEASNGVEALELLRSSIPHLIISDLVMPVMDGYQLCRIIKSDERLCLVPVMLLTKLSETEDVILGLNAGADYYITKPFANPYLLSRVQSVLHAKAKAENSGGNDSDGMEVVLADKSYTVRAGRRQMLNLLLSTYENAVQQNNELLTIQNQLRNVNNRLREQHAHLQQANDRLSSLATLDGLTGLKNHRAFQEKLEEEYSSAVRHQLPLSLLMVDVDHFKQFNDSHGHPAGDEVLKEVANIISRQARASDFAARYGGEEFALILPNTGAEASGILAERLRHAIESAPWDKRKITVSIGGASTAPQISDHAVLVTRADAALYQSKNKGRNAYTHDDSPNNDSTSQDSLNEQIS